MLANKKKIKRFVSLCTKNQKELKIYLETYLETMGYDVISEDGYIYAKGNIPYLLTAHMDTVHKVTCKKANVLNLNGSHMVESKDGIGGDDRCGVFIIISIINRGYMPSILFCEDEEIGGIGSNKFCKSEYINDLKEMNYLIELDRANANDAVFYDCGNEEFQQFILEQTGFKTAIGSFSDISHLSPACDVASVNLSCGYYEAHTTKEYVVMEEMLNTVDVVENLLNVEDCKKYDFQEKEYRYNFFNGYKYGYGYYDYYDDDYYDYYYSKKRKKRSNYMNEQRKYEDDKPTKKVTSEVLKAVEFSFIDRSDNNNEVVESIWGDSFYECLGQLFELYPNLRYNDISDYEEIWW